MDTIHNMRVFARIVEAGSFTSAAQHLNVGTGHASRAVSELEARLRTRLLNRTTRRVVLTEAGRRYWHHCEPIIAYLDQAEAEAADAHARPSGKLKVHAMSRFGQHYVVSLIARYQQRHPSVQVDLTFAQRVPDLLGEGYDVSLVLASDLPDSRFISQHLGSMFSIACASPAYIEKHGMPHTLSDLTQHTCLNLTAPTFPPDKWFFNGPSGQETVSLGPSIFTVNVSDSVAVAIREGMGIGVLPASSVLRDLCAGTIMRVLPQYTMQEMNVYALYPSRGYLDAKIRTWVELLRDELPTTLASDAASLLNSRRRKLQVHGQELDIASSHLR